MTNPVDEKPTDRRTFLERIIGPNLAKAWRRDLQEAGEELDALGAQRKEVGDGVEEKDRNSPQPRPTLTPKKPRAPRKRPGGVRANKDEEEGDVIQQASQKIAEQVMAAIGNPAELTEEKLALVIAGALRPVIDEDDPESDESDEETTMDDKKKQVPNEEQDDVQTLLEETFAQMVSDQASVAKSVTEQDAALKELLPLVKNLGDRLAQVEAEIKAKPRAASEDDETEPDLDDETQKNLTEAIKKGLNGPKKTYLGVEVKNIPT